MAEENNSEVKEIESCLDSNPATMSEEISVETLTVNDVEDVISVASQVQEECITEINEVVPKTPQSVDLRRYSTGAIGTQAGKRQVQSRYRGDHHVASTHDLCKHGKRVNKNEVVVKPWKVVRRKSVESSDTIKVETPSLRRQSMGSVSRLIPSTKQESSVAAKRDALPVKKKPSSSVKSESSSVKEDRDIARSIDGSSVRSNDKSLSGSVKKVSGLRSEKPSDSAMKKVLKISDAESSNASKVSASKMKKGKTQITNGEDVKEKTVCVVESSVKGVDSEKHTSSEKKTAKSGNKSLTSPKRGLIKKKESGSADLEAKQKQEKKVKPKRTGVNMTLPKQLTFKKGKTLEPKSEDSSPRWIKFRKRVVNELKPQTKEKKKILKSGVETKNDSCEGSKRERVVLRHRKVEGKKNMMTLFNSVIEETMNKLTNVKKTKVKALIGAFETVISLNDVKTPQKVQSKATTSASKVSPLGSEQ
ncbi:unnamed protein product [Cochlearia groenlandica]